MKLNKVLFMTRRLYTDLSDHSNMNLCFDNSKDLNEYYIVFEEKDLNTRGGNKPFQFDENGVPKIHSYIDDEKAGYYYYPITIGQYALAIYHTYLKSNDPEKKNHFLRIADWFVDSAIIDRKIGAYWLTNVNKPEFNMFEPWKSAFSQSRALSVLLRAWQLTKNTKYLELAKKALLPFGYNTSEGGVMVNTNDNDVVYEEYVASKPTRILDGAIFSLFGLYDAVRVFRNVDESSFKKASQLFDIGIDGLKHWLPKYDMGFWVFYNRCEIEGYPTNDPCTIGYLRLVSAQLTVIHNITGNEIFENYVKLFNSYRKPYNILRMYIEKYKALKKLNRL